ncbi:hypothetical protein SEA_BANTAM_160 [Gordonia phage Bantam]|uniref:Uncharacterized protein n=1 Tax=Gordonia phage Bantam TaxID=1887641 RepID=A0A1B3AYK9_9CAUD|nr:hypothetical protein BIZ77_gp019 [Gordonia phage Bantam]AOE43849.1 hypothetical protein SEA_BANTAM_160 [Gordonia phage Bantam]
MISRRGIRTPAEIEDAEYDEYAYSPELEMEYYLYKLDDGRLIFASCHDAVGLMTYFDIDQAGWNDVLEMAGLA